jgi:hypothetical protein
LREVALRRIAIIAPALLMLLSLSGPAAAQEPVTRADSAAVLVGTAERLHAQGSTELAAALARVVERRYADTPALARASALLALLRANERSSSGRIGLVAFTTIYGAWLGVAVPWMFDADRPEAYGLGLLTAAPLGFFGGRLFARERSISAGDAGLVAWSGSWGTWQGGGWMAVLGDDEDECIDPGFCSTGPEVSEVVGAMVIGGLAGIAASGIVADRTDVSGGTATMIGWGSLWGTGLGLVTSVLANLDDDEILAATLIGGDVGFASAALLAPRWDMSSGRAWLVNASGIMGAAIGGGVDLLIQPGDEDVAILIPTIGAAVGLGLGAALTRDMDEGRVRQGSLRDPRDASTALVRLAAGEWRFGLPQPMPVLLRTDGTPDVAPGLRVDLLDARF